MGSSKGSSVSRPAFLQRGHDLIALHDPGVDRLGGLVGRLVEVVDEVLIVAFAAHVLHADAVVLPSWAPFADRARTGTRSGDRRRRGWCRWPPKPLMWQMAQVAAGKSSTVKRAGLGLPIPGMTARGVGDAVRRFLVDLPLRVIRADVAGVAGLRLAGLLQAELMPQVARLTLADRAVCLGNPTLWQSSQAKRVISGPSSAKRALRILSGAKLPSGIEAYICQLLRRQSSPCQHRRRRLAESAGSGMY